MKNEKIRDALDQSMADMTWKEENRAQVLRGIRQEQPPVRVRRRMLVPVLALVLVLFIAAILELYTMHRISNELSKEAKKL